MPDNGQSRDNDIDRELRETAAHVEYPPTPDLAGSVRRRIEAEGSRQTSPWQDFLSSRWAAVAVVVVLISLPTLAGLIMLGGGGLGGAGGGAVQSAGSAGESGGGAADKQTSESTAAETTGGASSAAGSAAGESLGKGLGFGQRLSLREAQARSGGRLLQPPKSELGRLDEVYAGASPPDSYVFVYGARNGLPPMKETEIGLVLDQSDGDVKTYLVPGDTSGAGLEEVRVNDAPAYWSPSGDSVLLEARGAEKLSGNVLLWERDGQAFKLKADIGKEKAIQIAESVR